MKQKAYLLIALLCSFAQGAFAWDGSGTSADPYLIKNSADWKQLADDVVGGNSYSDKFFEMTADIDAEGISVGASDKPFSGTVSGGMHTLTYNAGTMAVYREGDNAPFVLLKGATIQDLKVAGIIYSKSKYAAGLACFVDGAKTTTISGCHVSTQMSGDWALNEEACFGGFVALVKSTTNDPLVLKNCSFQGFLGDFTAGSACFVGFTRVPVSIEHCVVDPYTVFQGIANTATFVRAADGVNCTLKECYYTQAYGAEQGQGVFKSVEMPKGCTAEIVSEPTLRFNDVNYYGPGTKVNLTVPEDTQFDHWTTEGKPVGCFISDPWTASGIHTISDIRTQPQLSIATSLPDSPQGNRQRYGINYRYLSNNDYKLFMSDSLFQARGYRFDKDGLCYFYDGEGTMTYLTAVWNCDANAETFQNYYRGGWFKDKDYEGCIIENDLVSDAWEHTHLFAISPRAFLNVNNLKRIIFKSDIDPTFRDNATVGLDVAIQEQAFKGSGLEELVMMYRNEKTSQWEVLEPTTGMTIAADAFEGTSAQISVDPSVYQGFLSDKKWSAHRNRFGIYAAKVEDMKVNGAVYSYWRDNQGQPVKNSGEGNKAMMETLKYWNADYQEFTASSLLTTSSENIWYSQVIGVDASSLDNGTMRIYNDPGSQYNYKTISIQSLGQSKDVKNIEFYQTNGLSDNSYSDLKMVIRNGAFKGCTNLKELRMFYYVENGEDHWETLGPKDVIPGENIFGRPSIDELEKLSAEEREKIIKETVPQDVKILVSPDRYQEFLDDPNWMVYEHCIEPVDFNPTGSDRNDFSLGGLTYGYMTSPGGIMQTSQTVSQDLSWWTAPRIGIELALDILTLGTLAPTKGEKALASSIASLESEVGVIETCERSILVNTAYYTQGGSIYVPIKEAVEKVTQTTAPQYTKKVIEALGESECVRTLQKVGIITTENTFASAAKLAEITAKYATYTFGDEPINYALKSLLYYTRDYITKGIAQSVENGVLLNNSAGIIGEKSAELLAMKNIHSLITSSMFTASGASALASFLSSECWGGTGSYNSDAMKKGMKANILSNIHQVGLVGGGYIITTPQKNLCYHTYIKDVPASTTDAVIYAGTGKKQGRNNNARTMTMAKNAFRDHKNLKTVTFHETAIQSDEAMPMLLAIPDSAFVGCTNLERFDLRVQTDDNGQQALGPESFILGGDSIFAGLDPKKFHIIIDSSRKQDFLDNESWKPLEQYFVYEDAAPKTQYVEYGGNYAYAYENGTTQKVNKVSGHKIEHTVVTGADNEFIEEHQGALKLCNDIGVWNNFQLDAVARRAFKGNQNLRVVNFTDLKGTGAYGDCYTGLQVALMDSCFADCKNLVDLDLLYLVTDGDNHIDPIKPEQVTLGKGVLDGTTAKIKMMPQQVEWFEADTTWNKYKDRFLPCIIKPGDKGILKALKPMAYYDMAHTGYDPTTWDEYIDLARIAGHPDGFAWLNGKFRDQSDDIYSFTEFKHFESVGLDSIGAEWFRGCKRLNNILLPSTIKTIREFAFATCYKLEEIELPAALTEIGEQAFNDCPVLKTIRVLGTKPAKLTGNTQFSFNDGLKIYVPAASVDAYKTEWAEYKDYIVSDATYHVNKVVTVTKPDELAEKLGLFVEMSYSGLKYGDEPRYVHGPYAKYDSLTISGPLGNVDLAVIRYLAGSDAYSGGGKATDGRLRYLNLYDADIKKTDDGYHYYNDEQSMVGARYDIKSDNKLPVYLFKGCTALETVILPKSLTDMEARIFAGCSALKRVAIAGSLTDYDDAMYLSGLLDYPLEELVFVSDKPAVSERNNPWGQPINVVFTKKSQLGDYMNQPYLTNQAQTVMAPFEEDAVIDALTQKGQFFPSVYMTAETLEGIFNDNKDIVTFDEFKLFSVKSLEHTFTNASNLKRISLPDSLKSIGAEAFNGCSKLDTIRIACEQVPSLAWGTFEQLPSDFRILVPKDMCKRYREGWPQYEDHIYVDEQNYSDSEWTVVTLDKPNTLAEKLGFEVNWDYRRMTVFSTKHNYINGVRGDYSKIHKLKVNGPISGSDFAFMRYLAGFCPWSNSRNAMGQLEAIDLYDADIKASDDLSAPDMFKVITHMGPSNVEADNELPIYAFLQAYNLKSLVLPKTCTKINTRAMQQCEALETLVLGDDLVDFDWSALDDDVMLTRLYIMAKQKPEMTQDNWVVRQLYNNYNPTFDAFYVRPSLYNEYLNDPAYTKDLQRTNLISKGEFDDDDSFCAFAKHAAATKDDLAGVTSVEGWFDAHPGAKNLTPLKYTSVDSLSKATLAPLTLLEQMAMPAMLTAMEDKLFENNKKLRYVDFLQCKDDNLIHSLAYTGMEEMGLNREKTLLYMPASYGYTGEDNVVVAGADKMHAQKYYLQDSLDYMVPYSFEVEVINNDRKLEVSDIPYTVCLPYSTSVPRGAKAYKLSDRDGNKLVFTEEENEMVALHPYLLKVEGNNGVYTGPVTLDAYGFGPQTLPSNTDVRMQQDDAPGYSMRGTLNTITNAEAADLGAYILQSDGDWHPVSTSSQKASILPFRAYLLPSARSAMSRIGMQLGDNATGIDSYTTIDQDGTERTYDLQGREINARNAKGVVIINGRKVIKK